MKVKKMYHKFELDELIEFTKTLKVLYVEDNKDVRDSILALLENFFVSIETAVDGKDGYEKFQESSFDLIFSDIRMPRMTGIEMIRLIRQEDDTIPIIVTTAHQETELLMDCIEIGVSGYLLKPINLKQLTKVIKQNCEKIYYKKQNELYEASLEKLVQERTKELEEAKEVLQKLVSIDPLTGLYNRRYFNEISKTLFNLSKRNNQPLSVLMIDIDRFKFINDSFGHMAGDKVLIHIAKEIMYSLRNSDVAVRFGGEEFLIILPGTPLQGATQIARKIKENIEREEIPVYDAQNNFIKLTVSIGIAECECKSDQGIDDLVHKSDEALYQAKRSGRDTIRCYNVNNCEM